MQVLGNLPHLRFVLVDVLHEARDIDPAELPGDAAALWGCAYRFTAWTASGRPALPTPLNVPLSGLIQA